MTTKHSAQKVQLPDLSRPETDWCMKLADPWSRFSSTLDRSSLQAGLRKSLATDG